MALANADLIFLDPDNGLEVASQPRGRKDSSKYVFWDEVESLWKQGTSLLLFQHFARENREDHTARLAAELSRRAPGTEISALTSSNVLFLLACNLSTKCRRPVPFASYGTAGARRFVRRSAQTYQRLFLLALKGLFVG